MTVHPATAAHSQQLGVSGKPALSVKSGHKQSPATGPTWPASTECILRYSHSMAEPDRLTVLGRL